MDPVSTSIADSQLLQAYVHRRSQEAFAALVERYINLVYSTSLRRVRDAHLAEDVTQAVFLTLAQKARRLAPGTILSGWLFQTASTGAAIFRMREGAVGLIQITTTDDPPT